MSYSIKLEISKLFCGANAKNVELIVKNSETE